MEDLVMLLPTTNRRQANWLSSIFNDANDLFDYDAFGKTRLTSPAVNVIENENEYRVEMAAPGMSKDNFKIRLTDDNQLVINMEKEEKNNEENKNEKYLRREFSYSKFEQALILPEDIKKEEIKASMEHGVLNIIIPKNTEAPVQPKERFIDIL